MHKKPLKPIIRYIFGDFAFEKHFDRFVFLVCMPILCLVSFSISCSHFSLSARFVCRFLYWRSMQECLLGNSIIFNFDAACVSVSFCIFGFGLWSFHTFTLSPGCCLCSMTFKLQGASISILVATFDGLFCIFFSSLLFPWSFYSIVLRTYYLLLSSL